MKDLHSLIAVETIFGPAVMDADNVPAAIDLAGYKSCEILLAIGAGGIVFTNANKIEFKLTHSEGGVTYEPVEDADLLGVADVVDGVVRALKAAHAAAVSYRIGYKGNRRFLKLLADFSGAHGTGTPVAALVIKGEPRWAPQT